MNVLALDLATLQRLYIEERKTTREIGAVVGLGHRTIVRLLRKHGVPMRRPGERASTLDQRFSTKFIVIASGCWQWIGFVNEDGYGAFRGEGGTEGAHRWAYRRFKGPIPEGYEVDHLCRFRACVNPDHLDAVTKRDNVIRGTSFAAVNASKTDCPNGHPLSAGSGQRVCRVCRRASSLAYYHRTRSAA